VSYGKGPTYIGSYPSIRLPEMMAYLYLPVCMGNDTDVRLPPNLSCVRPLVARAMQDGYQPGDYVYVSAKRLYVTPDNPGNRPGWHCDGFGSERDLNYVWADVFPTRYAVQEFENISTDHEDSTRQFEEQINLRAIQSGIPYELARIDTEVVHTTPLIPAPGRERQFVKISISPEKYNLEGNSHNYLFEYDWRLFRRSEIRNDPIYAERDYYPTEK